ncbi:MAG: EscU/YscU/HrcU family type III secretion system export apparatus switch protein [Tepidisphaeraceae bacterium]
MSDDFGDKTETPTPHRRLEARRAGNVARSADLAAAVLGFTSIMLLGQYGPRVMEAMKLILGESLGREAVAPGRIAWLMGTALTPLLAGLTLIAIAANVLQTGFLFVMPKNKGVLDPARGFGRMFDGRSAAQLSINAIKIVLVTVVAFAATRGRMDEIVGLGGQSIGKIASAAGAVVYAVAIRVAIVLLVIAVIDYAYQKIRHERDLRMTRREIKDEMRRLEGDPQGKQRRRSAAAAWAQARLMRDVAGASVVVTAGDDVAVALFYDATAMTSPRVAAKGNGATARQIRELAIAHHVALVDRPGVATGLFKLGQVGRDLPARFFAAAAEVLAYAQQITRKDAKAT